VDIDKLVAQITQEVVESLKAAPASPSAAKSSASSAAGASSPTAAGGSGFAASGSPAAPVAAAAVASGPVLLIWSPHEASAPPEPFIKSFAAAGSRVSLAAPAELAPTSLPEGVAVVIKVKHPGDAPCPTEGTVVFPVFRLDHLAKLAGLVADSWEVALALEALCSGRRVVVYPGVTSANPALAAKINSLYQELRDMGIGVEGALSPPSDKPWTSRVGRGSGRMDESIAGLSVVGAAAVSLAPEGAPRSASAPQACDASKGECTGCGYCPQLISNKVGVVVNSGADRVGSTLGAIPATGELARYIDHTLLKPDATREQIVQLCEEARQYKFASVCINPGFVALCSSLLKGSGVKVCTVIGFPLGATTTVAKAMETRDAIANGAEEIDMVINVGALKAGQDELVRRDIQAVVEAAGGFIVKVILETALLTDDEKVRACQLAKAAGADFVKTSTGFGGGGATVHDIALMRRTVGEFMGVKASGGIRDFETAQEMIRAGATRIGASASVSIVKGPSGKKQASSGTDKKGY